MNNKDLSFEKIFSDYLLSIKLFLSFGFTSRLCMVYFQWLL